MLSICSGAALHRFAKTAAAVLVGLSLLSCATPPYEPYYEPSSVQLFDFAQSNDYSAYVQKTRAQLKEHRVFHDPKRQAQELNQVAPFILQPPTRCGKPQQGVLLVHGLLDSAFTLKDIGQALAQDCILVYGLLLPGHGTRPADLLDTTKEQWLSAVQFGVKTLSQSVNDVSVIGFSLGGALATNVAVDNPQVKRLILLSPTLQVAYPQFAKLATWHRRVADWVDADPNHLAVSYQAIPSQAIAETVELSEQVQSKLATRSLKQPVLLVFSANDLFIDTQATLNLFARSMPNHRSQALVYTQNPSQSQQARVQWINAQDRARRIINYSHIALPFAPNNPVFGVNGSYKECGQHIGLVDKKDAHACLDTKNTWKGEFGTNEVYQVPFQRLTYNPRFGEMMATIKAFIQQ